MAQEPDLLIETGFSDAKLVRDSNRVVAEFRKRGEQAQKAFQDATGRITNTTAARAHARELDRLSKAYDPVYRAASKYEAEVKRLDRALDIGAISQDRYTAELADAAREMQRVGQVTNAAGAQIATGMQRAQTGAVALDRGIGAAGGGMGRFRSQVQNSAFQLQDFVVQVQNGTAASVAFSQQAPQLLGGFGALGAVLGLVAALAVPVGAALFSLGRESDDAAKMAEAFDKSLQSARSSLSEFNATINTRALGSIDALIEKYGRADEAVRGLEERMREAFRSDAFEGYQATIDQQALGGLLGADSRVAQIFGQVQDLRARAADARKELQALLEFDKSVGMQGQFGAVRLQQQAEIENSRESMERLNAQVERFGITPEQIATFTAAKDALDAALAAENFNGAIGALDVIQGVLRETGDETLVNVADQLDLVSADLAEAAAQAGELPPELAAAANEALALADYLGQAVGAINSLQGAISSLGVSNVGRQARLAALQAGQSAGEASIEGRVAERQAELEQAFDGADANFTGVQRELTQYEQGLRDELRLTEEISALEDKLRPDRPSRRSGSGKGGGDRKKAEERPLFEGIDTQMEGLERQITLIGKSNQEIATARARWEALDEAKRRGIPVNDEMSAQIEKQAVEFGLLTAELEKAEAAQAQFDQAINGIADAMAGALLAGESLREGLAQVLKGIASDILNSGIRSALSGQFSMGGGGFKPLALIGNIFGGGDALTSGLRSAGAPARLPSFSGGGFTGYGARSGGVDGEGGFHAIVHPNETILDHTRGQGAGGQSVLMVDLSPDLQARILDQAMGQSIQITQQAQVAQAKALPGKVQRINAKPRQR